MKTNPFSKQKGPKVLDHVRLMRSGDGKLMAEHHFKGYAHEPETFQKKTDMATLQHAASAMGIDIKTGEPDGDEAA